MECGTRFVRAGGRPPAPLTQPSSAKWSPNRAPAGSTPRPGFFISLSALPSLASNVRSRAPLVDGVPATLRDCNRIIDQRADNHGRLDAQALGNGIQLDTLRACDANAKPLSQAAVVVLIVT
jgi:hypothetical protein